MRRIVLDKYFAGVRIGDHNCLVIGTRQQILTFLIPRNRIHTSLVHLQSFIEIETLQIVQAVCEVKDLNDNFK